MEELEYLSNQEDVIGLYNYEKEQKRIMSSIEDEFYLKGKEEGIEQGKEEGIEQGKEEGKKEIVLRMIQLNKDIEEIMEITGLSVKEIERIKRY